MRGWPVTVVAAVLLFLTACSGQEQSPAGQRVADPPPVSAAGQQVQAGSAGRGMPPSKPTEIRIPKIGATSSLVPLGLNADGTVEVPPVEQPMQAGWYDKAPTPGEVGPAVVLGHVDGNHKPGIFHRLRELAAGDEVLVSREDGTTARFKVTATEQVAKREFPTERVYGDTAGPELRLITCGGQFDKSARSYQDNIIVFATLAV